jgi:hypothetical protein
MVSTKDLPARAPRRMARAFLSAAQQLPSGRAGGPRGPFERSLFPTSSTQKTTRKAVELIATTTRPRRSNAGSALRAPVDEKAQPTDVSTLGRECRPAAAAAAGRSVVVVVIMNQVVVGSTVGGGRGKGCSLARPKRRQQQRGCTRNRAPILTTSLRPSCSLWKGMVLPPRGDECDVRFDL